MERVFLKSDKRTSIPLEGSWNITFSATEELENSIIQGHSKPDTITHVPSCWNFEPGRFDYMGAAWYTRTFIADQCANGRLIFHAVSGQTTVYLDGKELGQHYGSYNRFSFDVPNLSAGIHTLAVKVDNTVNDQDTLPLRFVDWYVYGGIYREVELELYQQLSIDQVKIDSQWDHYSVSKVLVEVTITNWTDALLEDTLLLEIESHKQYKKAKALSVPRCSSRTC